MASSSAGADSLSGLSVALTATRKRLRGNCSGLRFRFSGGHRGAGPGDHKQQRPDHLQRLKHEIDFGLFQAFGVVGALLLVIAGTCAAVAAGNLKRKPLQFPSLSSRLRVAVKASPLGPDQIAAARDNAAAILSAPSSPATRAGRSRWNGKPELRRDNKAVAAGLILIATLLGWAAVRRRHHARRMEA